MKTALTLDEAATRPLDLGCNDDASRDPACPHNARACLYREDAAAGYVGCASGREHHDIVLKIAVHRLVSDLTLGLLGSDAPGEWLDVRHIPC